MQVIPGMIAKLHAQYRPVIAQIEAHNSQRSQQEIDEWEKIPVKEQPAQRFKPKPEMVMVLFRLKRGDVLTSSITFQKTEAGHATSYQLTIGNALAKTLKLDNSLACSADLGTITWNTDSEFTALYLIFRLLEALVNDKAPAEDLAWLSMDTIERNGETLRTIWEILA